MQLTKQILLLLLSYSILLLVGCGDNNVIDKGTFQLNTARIGNASILSETEVSKSPNIVLVFSTSINTATIGSNIELLQGNTAIDLVFSTGDQDKLITLTPAQEFMESTEYQLVIKDGLLAVDESGFPGIILTFSIGVGKLEVVSFTHENSDLLPAANNLDITNQPVFELELSASVAPGELESEIIIVGESNYLFSVTELADRKYEITVLDEIPSLSKFNILLKSTLGASIDREFDLVSYQLYTKVSDIPFYPIISDEDLMTLVQEQTFKYFWDFGHPVSGMARERNTSGDVVTSGGTGFGLMAMIVAVERGFITREEALGRWNKIVNFLESADRFHGVWPHWMNGVSGEVIPFSTFDNGGDLVETAFLIEGLLCVRQYLDPTNSDENTLIETINELWLGVEWSWYQRGGQDQLYWHWSPNYEWQMNLQISGHNETQIIYTLAAASPTFGIDKDVYTNGYAKNGQFANGNTFYGYDLPLGYGMGGPLFFAHYSYLGMDPRKLKDEYADYWTQNVNHTLINRAYCIDNPKNFVGYSASCWGLTASDNHQGYNAHSPTNDLGVVTPTAALSSIVYTPEESLEAMRHFYFYLGEKLWGEYGFYDAFNPSEGWVASSYLAIDQGPIICMIENYRTGLLWDLYMSAPEVQDGLDKLEFTY